MARSSFKALKGPLARALGGVATAGQPEALQPIWAETVGPVIAARSRTVKLEHGVLTVEADGEFAGDLVRAESELRSRLQELMGERTLRRIEVIRAGPAWR